MLTSEQVIKSFESHENLRKPCLLYWDKIGKEVSELVNNIKTKPKLYKDDYGYYLGLFGSLQEMGINNDIAAYLLLKADGNFNGIIETYKMLRGI